MIVHKTLQQNHERKSTEVNACSHTYNLFRYNDAVLSGARDAADEDAGMRQRSFLNFLNFLRLPVRLACDQVICQ